MKPVGIIPNPASGKDIRRLVAYGSVFDNNEKVNIVRRVVLGLDAMGVKDVLFMPDYFGIGIRALEDLTVSVKTDFLDMPVNNNPEDSAVIPFSPPLEDAMLPDGQKIITAVKEVLG